MPHPSTPEDDALQGMIWGAPLPAPDLETVLAEASVNSPLMYADPALPVDEDDDAVGSAASEPPAVSAQVG
jgi:hypothetical protein